MAQNFPSIGLMAVLNLSGFEKEQRQYQRLLGDMQKQTKATADAITKSGQRMVASFDDLTRASKTFAAAQKAGPAAYSRLYEKAAAAFANLGRGAQVNVQTFDALMAQGVPMQTAMGQAASGATAASVAFSGTAAAVAAVTAAIAAGIKVTRDAIRDYAEMAEATRRLHYQTGMLAEQASGWAVVAQAAGISTASFERALTSMLGKAEQLQADLRAGRENTTDFARAVSIMRLELENADGTLKSADQLLADVNERLREYGPGVLSASLATDLLGYSGRQLLPLLTDQNRSLQEWVQYAEEVGATITSADLPSYEAWRTATIELSLAGKGLGNELAQSLIPTLTSLATWTTETMRRWRELNAEWGRTHGTWLGLDTALERVSGAQSDAARSEAALAQERYEGVQAAARAAYAEQELAKDREKALAQLADLRADLAEKLEDIERSAGERWADLERQRDRDTFERALQLHWRLIDLARDLQDARADAIRAGAERAADAERDVRRRIEDAEQDARERREDLERDHQERLADIRQDYLDTVQEAARANDAVAVARAMRERVREQRDAERQRQEDRADQVRALERERQEIRDDAAARAADQERDLARTLQRLEEAHRERLADLELAQERERTLRELHERQQEEDLELALSRQEEAARLSFDRQRDDLQVHLDQIQAQLEGAIRSYTDTAAAGAAAAAATVAQVWASEITRYAQYLPYSPTSPEIDRYRQYQTTTPRPPILVAQQGALGQWSIPGHPMISMAEGGVIHAASPTTVMMGEGGPETGYFVPGGAGGGLFEHRFGGRVGVDFGGLPAGLNTQQVQGIVNETVIKLVKSVKIPRA